MKSFLQGYEEGTVSEVNISLDNGKDIQRAGEVSLLVLEGVSHLFKARLIGLLFSALKQGHIDYRFFEYAVESVSRSSKVDLEDFIENPMIYENDQREHLRNLSSHGFTRPYGDNTFGNIRAISYEITEFGVAFLKAIGISPPEMTTLGVRDENKEELDLVKAYKNTVTSGKNEW